MLIIVALLPLLPLYFIALQLVRSIRLALLVTATVYGVILVVLTEVLSLFTQFTVTGLLVGWGVALLLLLIAALWVWWKRPFPQSVPLIINEPSQSSPAWPEYLLILGIVMIVLTTGLIALAAPPNTWDSMVYHMGRVVYWSQNQSVAHFPAHTDRQLYQPPFAEYVIAHLQLLSGGDDFANGVQWGAMLLSVVGVSVIAGQLGLERRGQIAAAALCASLPIGIAQASNTKNDYVLALWVICLMVFILWYVQVQQPSLYLYGLAGAALGLALLTKGTAYAYVFPVMLWWAWVILRRLMQSRFDMRNLLFGGAGLLMLALLLNAGHYGRNFDVYGSPLGPSTTEYRNEVFGVMPFVSNLVRNLTNHVDIPPVVDPDERIRADLLTRIVELHHTINLEINDSRLTYPGVQFLPPSPGTRLHEDFAANTLHLLLMIAALLVYPFMVRRRVSDVAGVLPYMLAVMGGFLLFVLLFKWQPWHTRLHLPFFVLGVGFVAVVFARWWRGWLLRGMAFAALILAFPYVAHLAPRPLMGENSVLSTPRQAQYFVNLPYLEENYGQMVGLMNDWQCRRVGLMLPGQWDYPLYQVLNAHAPATVYPVGITGESASQAGMPIYRDFVPCAVMVFNSSGAPAPDAPTMIVDGRAYRHIFTNYVLHVFVPDA